VLLFAARDCPRILNLIRRGSRSKFERGRAALQQARAAGPPQRCGHFCLQKGMAGALGGLSSAWALRANMGG
jgi:hypothetical protein